MASSRNTLFGGAIVAAARGHAVLDGDNVVSDRTNADTINTITPLTLH